MSLQLARLNLTEIQRDPDRIFRVYSSHRHRHDWILDTQPHTSKGNCTRKRVSDGALVTHSKLERLGRFSVAHLSSNFMSLTVGPRKTGTLIFKMSH